MTNGCLQEEDEFPDDETINQMIARTEEEFETYQVIFELFKYLKKIKLHSFCLNFYTLSLLLNLFAISIICSNLIIMTLGSYYIHFSF